MYIQFEIIDPPNETIYLEMPRETTIEMIKFHIKYNIDGYQNLRPKDMMFLINGRNYCKKYIIHIDKKEKIKKKMRILETSNLMILKTNL